MPLLIASATAQYDAIDDLAAITAPVGASLRYSFTSLEHRTGLSTIASLTMRELARARPGRVLAVDTARDQSARDALRDGSALDEETFARIPERIRHWMRHHRDLVAVAFENGTRTDWNQVVAPAVRHFDIVGTDWGALPLADATQTAVTADVVCITGSYERDSAEAAIGFARALTDQAPGCRPVVVLSDITATRSTWPGLIAPRLTFPLVAVPHDPSVLASRSATAPTRSRARRIAGALRRASDEKGPTL